MKDRWLVLFCIFTPVVLVLTYLTVSGPRISPLYLPIFILISMVVLSLGKSPRSTSNERAELRRRFWWLLPSMIVAYIVAYAISQRIPQVWFWLYAIFTILVIGYYISWRRAHK
jgi:uncharacterized membrane protein YfcA